MGQLPRAIGERLKAAGWRIALIETATGGAVSDRLTDVAGSSAYFAGALNPRAVETLEGWLPDSGEALGDPATLARRAAAWLRADLDVDVGIAVIGDPAAGEGPSAAKVCIAVHSPQHETAEWRRFRGTGPQVQDCAALATLRLLYSCLESPEVIPSPR